MQWRPTVRNTPACCRKILQWVAKLWKIAQFLRKCTGNVCCQKFLTRLRCPGIVWLFLKKVWRASAIDNTLGCRSTGKSTCDWDRVLHWDEKRIISHSNTNERCFHRWLLRQCLQQVFSNSTKKSLFTHLQLVLTSNRCDVVNLTQFTFLLTQRISPDCQWNHWETGNQLRFKPNKQEENAPKLHKILI